MRPMLSLTATAAALVLALGSGALPEDGVWLYRESDPDYRALGVPDSVRLDPDRPRRLVILRGGRVVLDRGLRDEVRPVTNPTPGLEEMLETAELASDHSAAVVHTVLARSDAEAPEGVRVLATRLSWVEPEHPEGRWSVTLEAGRLLRLARVLPRRRGALVSTARDARAPGDLRWYEPSGRLRWEIREDEAGVRTIQLTSLGAFAAVELVYPERPGGPQRGLLVLDLLADRRWSYAWRYGDEREPLVYALDDTGRLELTLADGVYVYDRTGRILEQRRR